MDIRDLTWEQKEKVLRHLFARMNSKAATAGQQPNRKSSLPIAAVGAAVSAATPCIMDKEAWFVYYYPNKILI